MNREIKFRAWHKHTSKGFVMSQVINIGLREGLSINTEDGSFPYITEKEYGSIIILMQFTGLYDKNGKEIYEGDILKSITRNKIFTMPPGSGKWEWSKFHESLLEVYSEPGMWLVRFVSDKSYHAHLVTAIVNTKDSEGSIEVIGNIYEHKTQSANP